ncbi:hypothetical protein CDD81_3185 [Ophiocordyceps australis]|uniref:Uncharacterized protein n=1 Tax=Ophiocordyceps australis TaxID=1399860 RepID=A0A2C5XQ99_9HYPO|nr:hypothetical protein CDD81_3185 [Ophiocordyceps australis]
MSRSLAQRIYMDALTQWPKQKLRPDCQFQDVMREAAEERFRKYQPSMESDELLKARALQYLLQDKCKNKYKLKGPMLEPKSQPTYFSDLAQEIDEAPKRTWLERLGKKLTGMIRLE